jgi:hypothetical protein
MPGALSIFALFGQPMPIGTAFPAGLVVNRQGPAVAYRLVISKVEIEGRWLCVGREFIRLGEAAKYL